MKWPLAALAMIALAFSPSSISAQPSGKYEISGVVINAATGQPLDRADVTLHSPDSGSLVAETSTNAEGRFVFERLTAAKYSLRASHRGYIPDAYDEHEGFSTAIVTGEGLVSGNLTFRLSPQAVISGVVTDDAGDPVQQAKVSLYRQNLRNGLGNIVRAGTVMTDDLGAYEFARLQPGNYYIAVSATPWYATHPQPTRDRDGNSAAESVHSPLNVAYATTFYADVTDSDSATPIPIKAGDRIPVNFTLHAVPAVHIVMDIPAGHNNGLSVPQLRESIFGTTDTIQGASSSMTAGRDGQWTMEVAGVAPGHYEISSPGSRETPGHFSSVDATNDIKIDPQQTSPVADVSGKLAMAGGEKLPLPITVSLRSATGQTAGSTRMGEDGSFTLSGISPGSYELWVSGTGSALAVMQMKATGAVVDGHILKVGTQSATITATLAEGTATVSGFVRRDGKPLAGVMVLLVPHSPTADREMFRRDQSDSDGSFTLKRVIPGEYTLVAIEDGWTLDWARPEVIAHYLAGGQKVTVPPHSRDITLSGAVEVQQK
jgi:Carboxypeptidase regulatory-like domain